MIVILDGNSIAYRAYHKSPPLTAPDGMPTGTVHIFFTILEKVRSQLKPSQILATFDAKGETERHKKYPAYKANREAMPEDLAPQITLIREILPLAGVPVYHCTGIEADDIIATLARNASQPIVIVSKDKDLFQLVNDNIKIYDDQTGKLLGEAETLDKYGVTPNQMLSYLSLLGDKSDNIPGVHGVGEKTAAKLIGEYQSLDNLYANISEIKGKLKENLERDKNQAYTAMELITLADINPLPSPHLNENKQLLAEKLSALGLRAVANKLITETPQQTSTAIPPVVPLPHCSLGEVTSPAFFMGINGELWVSDGKTYDKFHPSQHKIPENAAFYDVKSFIKTTGETFANARDYLLISWLCDPDTGTFQKAKTEEMEEFIPRFIQTIPFWDKKLAELSLERLYADIELPMAHALALTEKRGIIVNPERVQSIANLLKQKIAQVASKLINRAEYAINLNSPKQLSEYLYDKLCIPPLSKTNKSTAEDVLKELSAANPQHKETIEEILLYREYSKLLSTYTQPLIDAIGEDGRVHTTFKQTGTATGRLSSVNPNLQNVPVRGEVGKTIRSAFTAAEGYCFVSLDYSQIELRVLAHLSGDLNLAEAFRNNQDIHTATAMKIFHLAEHDVTPDARRLAKAVNFGIVYGLSAFGLSRDAGVTPKEAKEFIDAYFGLYPRIKTYISDIIGNTKERGYCETVMGRKRFFPDINSANALVRQRAERAAMNAPIQGSAADIIKLAMLECNDMIKTCGFDAAVLLQIHDELIFEVRCEHSCGFVKHARAKMETAFALSVPLAVNSSVGLSWGDLK